MVKTSKIKEPHVSKDDENKHKFRKICDSNHRINWLDRLQTSLSLNHDLTW